MDFKSYLEISARQMSDELEKILSEFLNETKKTNIALIPFALGFINSCKGGKRIRGVLCKLGFELAISNFQFPISNFQTKEITKVAVAYEILHAGILIHDDIIDQSPLRRGQPTLYKSFGGDHYGISQAISLGDIGLSLPIKIISASDFPDQNKIKALAHLSQTVVNTAWGEILDIEPDKDIILVNKLKTAQYTICGPLILGALLAGAEENLIKSLRKFGEAAGIAYQIQDDILDGEESLLNNKEKALEYTTRAKKLIPKISNDPKIRILLKHLSDYLLQRTK